MLGNHPYSENEDDDYHQWTDVSDYDDYDDDDDDDDDDDGFDINQTYSKIGLNRSKYY